MIFKDIYCIIILDFGNWLVCRLISIVKTAAEGNICSHNDRIDTITPFRYFYLTDGSCCMCGNSKNTNEM